MPIPRVKRALDIVGAAAGLVLLMPWMAVTMIAIRLESPGFPIFVQKRVGRKGRIFNFYKLRTMRQGTPELPTHKIDSSVVTPLGRQLRHWKLDEFPQLFNVLVGDMSLVGPRPSLVTQTDVIDARRKLGVLDANPGITGLAQVQGIDTSEPERLAKVDAEYTRKAGLASDIALLAATLSGKGMRMDHVSFTRPARPSEP